MLEKCLQGETQNTNESFNGMIWNRVSKVTHVGFDVLSVGVYDAFFTLIMVKKLSWMFWNYIMLIQVLI